MCIKKIPDVKVFSFTKNDIFIEKNNAFYEILKNEFVYPSFCKDKKKIKKKSETLEFFLNLANNILKQIRESKILNIHNKKIPPFSSSPFTIENIYRVK